MTQDASIGQGLACDDLACVDDHHRQVGEPIEQALQAGREMPVDHGPAGLGMTGESQQV